MDTVKVLVGDDHRICLQGYTVLLEREQGVKVVASTPIAGDIEVLAAALGPDVLILDPMFDGLDGIEIVQSLHQKCPAVKIIVLTGECGARTAVRALRAGASGLVEKRAEFAKLVEAIHAVMKGRRYLCPAVSDVLLGSYLNDNATQTETSNGLSRREDEILNLMGQGLSYAQIAERLFISVRTVESHRARISRKLGLRTQADLIRFALIRTP